MATETQLKKQEELRALKENPNVQRMLYAIMQAEGTWSEPDHGTTTSVGYNRFADTSDHPRKVYKLKPGLSSSAAGRYQFMPKTWDGLVKQYGFDDFGAENQDLAAIALIKQRGALDAVLAGKWDKAIPKLNREWASFPGDVYGQGGKSMSQMLKYLGEDPQTFQATTNVPEVLRPKIVPTATASVMTPPPLQPTTPVASALFQPKGELPPNSMSMTFAGQPMIAVPETAEEADSFLSVQDYDEETRGRFAQLLGSVQQAEQQAPTYNLFPRMPNGLDDRILQLIKSTKV